MTRAQSNHSTRYRVHCSGTTCTTVECAPAWLATIMRSAFVLAAAIASSYISLCSAKCKTNQHSTAQKKCEPCPKNMVRDAGDDETAGKLTYCDPVSGVYLSIDDLLRADGQPRCREQVAACFAESACVDKMLKAIRRTGFKFQRPVSPKMYNVITCAAAVLPPPPPPPGPPPPNGGANSGPVNVRMGGLFPLTGSYCEAGWHAHYGAWKAIQVLNCETAGPESGVALSSSDATKVGIQYNSSKCQHNLNVELVGSDTKAVSSQALYDTDQILHKGVDAIIGPEESSTAKLVSLFSQFDQVPVVSYGASMAKLGNVTETGIQNFLRTFPSDRILIKGLVDFIQLHKWEGVTFISTDDEFGMDASKMFSEQMENLVQLNQDAGHQAVKYSNVVLMDSAHPLDIIDKLNQIKDSGWRIIVLYVTEANAIPILHQAAKLRMLRLGWVWIGSEWATSSVYRQHNVSVDGSPDGLSEDGTGGYLADELAGLIAMKVADISTQTGRELANAWKSNEGKAFARDRNATTLCPGLVTGGPLHKSGAFAFDAVMAAAAGMQKMANKRTLDKSRVGHWWRHNGISIDAGGTGRSQMWRAMQSTSLNSLATGVVDFTENGDPDMVRIDVENWNGKRMKQVGTWVQNKENYEECIKSKQVCGVLRLDKNAVVWMGGAQGGSPPDRAGHINHIHAIYMTLVIVLLIFAIVGGNLIEIIHFHYMPEAGFTIVVGLAAGLIVKAYGYYTKSYHMEELATFDEKVFALVLLPIIIFDAGFGAKKARFFMNLGPILLCALVGTCISTVLVGCAIHWMGDLTGVTMGYAEALTYGAVISAVDPVATLAVFGALKVEPNLNYRVFGESIINDACSIVLFRVFQKFITHDVTAASALAGCWSFVVIFVGSTLAGIVVGMIASLTIKLAHIHDPLLAAGTFIICSYISYEASEAVHLSGIIASLFCGFAMKHYALNNISEQFQTMVMDLVHMLALMADLMIFFSVGTNVILMAPYDKKTFIVVSMIMCLIGRICNIFPLCALWNSQAKDENKIPFKDQIVMVHAGLRGAIAFNLALFFPTQNQKYVIDATTW